MPNNVQQVGVGTLRVWCGCAEEPAGRPASALPQVDSLWPDLPTGLTTSRSEISQKTPEINY
jgi:hypothetical protein